MPLTSACLIACGVMTGAGSVWNAVEVQRGDTAAVFGVGGVGLERDPGAGRSPERHAIIAVDTVAQKEPLARQFGATDFVLAERRHARQRIRELVPYSPTAAHRSRSLPAASTGRSSAPAIRPRSGAASDSLEWGGTAVASASRRREPRWRCR